MFLTLVFSIELSSSRKFYCKVLRVISQTAILHFVIKLGERGLSKRTVSGISLTMLLIGMCTLAFNIRPVKASKPLAPNGVHNMGTYESRISEQGLLFEDYNLQMWVPASYETHSKVIFEYLVWGYGNLSSIFGDHEYPYKFSVEHYPEGSPYIWGGTDARGTIRYGYGNLEDDTPEWNLYGVPHVIGYYEEMSHCFVYDFGVRGEVSVGFYETLGMMIGGETTLRAAYNPYIEGRIEDGYQTFKETTIYYLEHDDYPGVSENIWLTRVLAHIFKTEVIDVHGWNALSEVFENMRDSYPLRRYDRDHTWGGFLYYLGEVTATDFHAVFGNYGLPMLTWTSEIGYETDGVEKIGDSEYRFRVRCLDREGKQPVNVKLHLYSEEPVPGSSLGMLFVSGDNESGWIYEVEVNISIAVWYAFSADDCAHSIFQAVGLPTFLHQVVQPYGPTADFTVAPETTTVGESVKFDASDSLSGFNGTHEMPIVEYRWDFGGGINITTSTPIVYYSFISPGIYYVTLTVYAPGATPETDSVTHKVTTFSVPVGGYSVPIKGYTTEKPLTLYLALVAILTVSFTIAKRRKKQQN